MIIAFGHKAGVGKDTSADYIAANYGFTKISFADPIKEAAKVIFGLSQDQMYNQEEKLKLDEFWGETPRVIMQKFGTECMRKGYANDIWVRALHRRLKYSPDKDWVIADLRFTNEAFAINSWGGIAIKLNRDTGYKSQHISERDLDGYGLWDEVIDNNGTKENLFDLIEEIMKKYSFRKGVYNGRDTHSI